MPVRQPPTPPENVVEREPQTTYDVGARLGRGLGYLALIGLAALGVVTVAAVAGFLRAVAAAAYAWGLAIL